MNQPLSPHFRADGEPAVVLNRLQIEARDQVMKKLASGAYGFIDSDCPLCGSASRKLLSEKDATGIPVETSLCLACGSVYASRRLDDTSLNAFYENENLKLDRGIESGAEFLFQGEHIQGAHIADTLSKHQLFEKLRDSLIVEIGCGPGGILSHFKKLGFEVLGFDIDPGVVAYGRSQGLELHHGGAGLARQVLQSKSRRLGLLIYSQALEHMTDPRQELKNAKYLMDREALLFIGVPGLRNLGSHYRYDFLNYLQPGHLIHFERSTLARLLMDAGFEEVFADECIDSVFRLADRPQPVQSPASGAAQAMLSFLIEAERKRSRAATLKNIRRAIGMTLRFPAWLFGQKSRGMRQIEKRKG